MDAEITIPARFNGPPTSGNGGYSCGVLAAYISGPARIRLHVPPPLDVPLRVATTPDGGVEMHRGEILVGSGAPASLNIAIPDPPSLEAAQTAMADFPCYEGHSFPTCFVCGPERSDHDGLRIFPGPVTGTSLVACPWVPGEDLLDENGDVLPEILWSALDCPGYFAAMGAQLRPAVLGELAGELPLKVRGAQSLLVYAWSIAEEGRKFQAGSAIATTDGEIVAHAKSTWIQLKA
jgi:hypothetical protein